MNANEHPLRIKLSAHIRTGTIMELQRNKVCGIDVHKRFLIATILCRDGKKDTQRFWSEPLRVDKKLSNADSWREVHEEDQAALRPGLQDISISRT